MKRADLRATLGGILEDYAQLMVDTGKVAADICALASRRSSTLKMMQHLQKIQDKKRVEELLIKVDVSSLTEEFDLNIISDLVKRYDDLVNKICSAVCLGCMVLRIIILAYNCSYSERLSTKRSKRCQKKSFSVCWNNTWVSRAPSSIHYTYCSV